MRKQTGTRIFTNKLFCLCTPLLLICCAPNKKFVKVSPGFEHVRNEIDSICIFPDALIAVQDKKDFYSLTGSSIADSLIIRGADSVLRSKGYATTFFKSDYSGWFVDTLLSVPIKKAGASPISMAHLPCSDSDGLPSPQVYALRDLCRQVYLRVASSANRPIAKNLVKTDVVLDSETIKLLGRKDYVLFVYHQACVSSPEIQRLSAPPGLGIGPSPLFLGISLAMFISSKIAEKKLRDYRAASEYPLYNNGNQTFRTYTVLYRISTRTILWCNYSSSNIGIDEGMYSLSTDTTKQLSDFVHPDTLEKNIVYRWQWNHLVDFPDREGKKYFNGYKKTGSYPFGQYFQKIPHTLTSDTLVDHSYLQCIDSIIINLSLSDSCTTYLSKKLSGNIPADSPSKHRGNYWANNLSYYLQYAYCLRLMFHPQTCGRVTLCVTTSGEGVANEVWLENSALNDPVFAQVIVEIVRKFDFNMKNMSKKECFFKFPLEFSVDNPKRYQVKTIYDF